MHTPRAGVAQLAEQPSCKRQAIGSNPITGSQYRLNRASAVAAQAIGFTDPDFTRLGQPEQARFA
jgi:hypothetical protein